MVQVEKLNILKKYFKVGIKRLLENPESAFEKSANVQESIFKSMSKEGTELLKEMNAQFGTEAISALMTTCMIELFAEDPTMMADLLKHSVDHVAKLENEFRKEEKIRMEFRKLVKEVSERTGEPGSKIVLGLDYSESIENRIEQLEKICLREK